MDALLVVYQVPGGVQGSAPDAACSMKRIPMNRIEDPDNAIVADGATRKIAAFLHSDGSSNGRVTPPAGEMLGWATVHSLACHQTDVIRIEHVIRTDHSHLQVVIGLYV